MISALLPIKGQVLLIVVQMQKVSLPLINELQTDGFLAQSVKESRRSDFALMLALMSRDVREQSQFHLPHTAPAKPDRSGQYYRTLFQLGAEARLSIDKPEEYGEFDQASQLSDNLASIRLSQCLRPRPLAIHNNKKRLDDAVQANLPPYLQYRLNRGLTASETISEQAELEIGGWLNAINASRESSLNNNA